MNIISTEEAIKEIKEGKMIILLDNEDRENEGDLVFAAEFTTPSKINFMAKNARGLICTPVSKKIAKKLEFNHMHNSGDDTCNFATSIDLRFGITTGISAEDRSKTIKKIIDDDCSSMDFVRPGHIFPLIANENGVLARGGHTEGSLEFCKLAGLKEASVICEIIDEDGVMARGKTIENFANKHNIKIATIDNLVSYVKKYENIFEISPEVDLPTKVGKFKCIVFKEKISKLEHIVLMKGDIKNSENLLTRIHSSCTMGDVFYSEKCDCHGQLEKSLKKINKKGIGLIIRLDQEGRGSGIFNQILSYKVQEDNNCNISDSMRILGFKKPDLREYEMVFNIINILGVKSVNLMTNSKNKEIELRKTGLNINEITSF